MTTKQLIEKAAQQILCEKLGYDEGRAYYLLLTGDEKALGEEFSYSKKYRLYKNLYRDGAVAKIRPINQEYFTYLPLPPTFLRFHQSEEALVTFLEKNYQSNYKSILNQSFFQIFTKHESGLLLFFLKYLMKTNAQLRLKDPSLRGHLGKKAEKVTLFPADGLATAGIIDNALAFELSTILDESGETRFGFFAQSALATEIPHNPFARIAEMIQNSNPPIRDSQL